MPFEFPICFKCRKQPGRYLSRDGPSKLYCVDCFCNFCVKNARDGAMLSCQLPSDTPICVAVSGGAHSLFLLHQLGVLRKQYSMRHKEGAMRFVLLPFMLREDHLLLPPFLQEPQTAAETARCGAVEKHRKEVCAQLDALERQTRSQMATWSFAGEPLYHPDELQVVHYTDFFEPPERTEAAVASEASAGTCVSRSLPALHTLATFVHHEKLSLSQREELYGVVKQRVLHLAAAHLAQRWAAGEDEASGQQDASPRWAYLATGEAAEQCAVNALAALVSGRGGDAMTAASGFRAYTSLPTLVHVRPLHGLLTKEIVLFLRLQGMPWSYTPTLSTGTALRSVRRVLEGFVLGLSAGGYRTSLFNVLQTATKLDLRPPALAEVCDPDQYDKRVDDSQREGECGDPRHALSQPQKRERKDANEGRRVKGKKQSAGPSALASRDRHRTWDPPTFTQWASATEERSSEAPSIPLCFLCGVAGVAVGDEVTAEGTVPELLPLRLPLSDERVSRGEMVPQEKQQAPLACHACRSLFVDVCGAPATRATRAVTAMGADATTSSSTGPESSAAASLLHALAALALRDESHVTCGGAPEHDIAPCFRSKKGELSDEDRAAYLL